MKILATPFMEDDKFFFNISGNVGPNCPNKIVDVQFVQFGYFAVSQNKTAGFPQYLIDAASAVVPGAPYSGAPNDPLTLAIKADERFRGGVQDGHVSVMRGSVSYDATHDYLVMRLCNNIRTMVGRDFPRIDRHPKCPPQLAESVRRSFEVR